MIAATPALKAPPVKTPPPPRVFEDDEGLWWIEVVRLGAMIHLFGPFDSPPGMHVIYNVLAN